MRVRLFVQGFGGKLLLFRIYFGSLLFSYIVAPTSLIYLIDKIIGSTSSQIDRLAYLDSLLLTLAVFMTLSLLDILFMLFANVIGDNFAPINASLLSNLPSRCLVLPNIFYVLKHIGILRPLLILLGALSMVLNIHVAPLCNFKIALHL